MLIVDTCGHDFGRSALFLGNAIRSNLFFDALKKQVEVYFHGSKTQNKLAAKNGAKIDKKQDVDTIVRYIEDKNQLFAVLFKLQHSKQSTQKVLIYTPPGLIRELDNTMALHWVVSEKNVNDGLDLIAIN